MVFVILQIRSGTTVLKAWYGCTVPDGASIADVYAGFSSGQLDKSLPIPEEYQASAIDVKVGKCRTDQIAVSLDSSITEVVSSLGQYMDFAVHGAIETMPLSKPVRDASTVLMQSSRSCHALPQMWQVLLPNRKRDLKNDIIDFLERNKLGWSPTHAQHCGKLFVNMLAEVLWNIDGNHQTLHDRGHDVPALFRVFKGYNVPENHKKKKVYPGRLKAAELLSHSSSLFVLAGNSYMKYQQWSSVHKSILHFAENLRKHAAYLNCQNEVVQDCHAKKVCVRTDVDAIKVIESTAYIKPTLVYLINNLWLIPTIIMD